MAVTQQPRQLLGPVEGQREWKGVLLACCTDCKSLECGNCCLPYAICNIASRLKEFTVMPWLVPGGFTILRTRIRTLGGIKGNSCNDCLVMSICCVCGTCQMRQELDNMGL